MPAAIRPTSVLCSRLTESNWQHSEGMFPRYVCRYGAFSDDTHLDAERATVMLTGMQALARNSRDFTSADYQINRIELVYNDVIDKQMRGAILFTQRGAMMHFVHALLGYGGSGSGLTSVIFELVGALSIFNDVNEVVAHRDYHVIMSRERTSTIVGVETALPYSEPLAEWRWWEV